MLFKEITILNENFEIEENMYVGITPLNDEMTYFGYMKKMLLTMHNLKCIDDFCLKSCA